MKQNIYKAAQIIVTILFIVGIVATLFFPFSNRDLKIALLTNEGEITEEKSSNDIEYSDIIDIAIPESCVIKKVKIYGDFNSQCLKSLTAQEFFYQIAETDGAEINLVDEVIEVKCDGQAKLKMDMGFQQFLQKKSETRIQERIMIIEILTLLYMLTLIVCSAIKDVRNPENFYNHTPLQEIKQVVFDLKKYGQYMVYAARADLRAEVANSYLNRLWWLLEPMFNMIVYVVVFGQVMGNSVENYATFVFSALLMWNFFNKTINYSVKLVRNNKDIVTKVYVPKFVLLISDMILNMFKLLFSLIVLVPMLVIFKVHIGASILMVIPAYIVLILFAFGVGMIFLHFGVYVDDLSYAVGILLTMLMFLSGIFYDVNASLPEPLGEVMMAINPVAMLIDTMRNALIYNTTANLPLMGVWAMISIVLCYVGIHTVYKNENGYVKVV